MLNFGIMDSSFRSGCWYSPVAVERSLKRFFCRGLPATYRFSFWLEGGGGRHALYSPIFQCFDARTSSYQSVSTYVISPLFRADQMDVRFTVSDEDKDYTGIFRSRVKVLEVGDLCLWWRRWWTGRRSRLGGEFANCLLYSIDLTVQRNIKKDKSKENI